MPKESFRDDIFRQYHRGTKLLKTIIESELELPLPDHIFVAWHQTQKTIRIADDVLDNTLNKDERINLVNTALDFLTNTQTNATILNNETLEKSLILLKSSLTPFEAKQRKNFTDTLGRICKITERIKTETNPHNMSILIRLEGQITSKLFTSLLPPEFHQNKNFHSFAIALSRMGRFGNTLDSFLDLDNDYKNGEVLIKSNWFNRFSLLLEALPDSINAIKNLKPQTTAKIGKKFIKKLII